jgi:hypothetical protein
MGEPIKVFGKDGREMVAYGPNQVRAMLAEGAANESPFPDAQPLPDDFPAATVLRNGGYANLEAVLAADDAGLLSVSGIGEATLKDIRAALKRQNAPKPAAKETLEDKVMKGKFAK